MEAIGKYKLISSPPIKHYQIVHYIHVSGPTFNKECNETIFKFHRTHLHGLGGHIDQGQGGVHHVNGELVLSLFLITLCHVTQ